MKCKACGSEWNTEKALQCCPFCGKELIQEVKHTEVHKCPVCDTVLPQKDGCHNCGYDPSCDVETFGTICAVLPSKIKAVSRQKQEYEKKSLQTPEVLLSQAEQAIAREDYRLAKELLHNAAEQGDANAQYLLGDCYYYGKGVDRNRNKAVEWYSKAALNNYARAQDKLGDCYYFGQGIAQDKRKAIEWYGKAAEQGFPRSQIIMGDFYYLGDDVTRDRNKAVQWYRRADGKGCSEAKFKLDFCRRHGMSAF